ncbi:DUF2441 domain-containing protein [Nitrosospira briensis]|uniref:DUF2441 domain-containing protein n=1 Tax=Nitrosospira briensis TaxID=35799 RepID=UPI00046AE064|nr:DUF2441 domain-containing protein [Nitrosospira briensis]
MKKTFFHVCSVVLEVGSIIKPGNWGRVITMYRPADLNALAVRELCYEIIRLKHFSDKPSRLNCIFLTPSLEHAINYVSRHHFTGIIYRVEPVNENASYFLASMSTINCLNFPYEKAPAIPYLMTLATEYWQGLTEITPECEILIDSPVRILAVHNTQVQISR